MIKEENDSPDTRHCHVSSQLKNEGNQQNLKKKKNDLRKNSEPRLTV